MVRSGSRGPLKWAPVRREPSNPLRDGGAPSLKDAPSPGRTLRLSPSLKGGPKPQQPLKMIGKRGPQLTLPPPLQQPSRPPHRERLTKKHLWTPLRCALGEEPPSLSSGGDPRPFDDKGPDMPKSEGWKADYFTFFHYFLRGHYSHIPPTQLRQIIEPVLRHLGTRREFWARLKEEDPLRLMPYLAAVFERQTGLALPALANYMKWIKAGSFYHGIIREREELNHTPHLAHVPVPNMNHRSLNEDALISHRQEYKAAFQQAETSLAALAKAQANFTTSLAICREDDREVRTLSLPEPLQAMVEILLNTAVGITHATSEEVTRYFQVRYPSMSSADAHRGANQLLVSLSEYQLECAIHDPSVVNPVISSQIDQELKPEEEYYDQPPEGTPVDFRLVEQGCTLRFATFLHRIDQTVTRGVGASNSVRVEEHGTGPLCNYSWGRAPVP